MKIVKYILQFFIGLFRLFKKKKQVDADAKKTTVQLPIAPKLSNRQLRFRKYRDKHRYSPKKVSIKSGYPKRDTVIAIIK